MWVHISKAVPWQGCAMQPSVGMELSKRGAEADARVSASISVLRVLRHIAGDCSKFC